MNAQTAQARPAESYSLFDGFARYGTETPTVPITESQVRNIPLLGTNPSPSSRCFIESNTKSVGLAHLKQDCVVPVFSKDNEVTVSHQNFIETVWSAAHKQFPCEVIDQPEIRVSHIVKGRIPEAIHKPVGQLLESDKTIYYERMMFCFEIPSVYEEIEGNRLNLSVGGVRAYNHENLYSKKTAEKFRVFIGFKNLVCCNLCVSTDGYQSELRAMSVQDVRCDLAFVSVLRCRAPCKADVGHAGTIPDRTPVRPTDREDAAVSVSASNGTERASRNGVYRQPHQCGGEGVLLR